MLCHHEDSTTSHRTTDNTSKNIPQLFNKLFLFANGHETTRQSDPFQKFSNADKCSRLMSRNNYTESDFNPSPAPSNQAQRGLFADGHLMDNSFKSPGVWSAPQAKSHTDSFNRRGQITFTSRLPVEIRHIKARRRSHLWVRSSQRAFGSVIL